jgi:hypothetical protein
MIFFTMFGYFTATFAKCRFVSFWFSCQQMIVGKAPSMTAAAALLAHWVLNTKIWLDCCMYCWSIADCCFESTFEGSGWEGGMFMGMCGEEEVGGPGASPMGPGPRGPPAPPSPAKSLPKSPRSPLRSSSLKSSKGSAPPGPPHSSFTPSFESNVSRKLSVSDLIPVAGGGCVPLAQLVGLVGGLLPGGFMSSREEGVAGAPSVPPGPVGVGGVLVSQLFSPFTELVFTLGGPSGSCLMGGGLARSPPSPSSLVRPGPREVREAFASAATVLFSFFIETQLPAVRHRIPPSATIPACPNSFWEKQASQDRTLPLRT